MLAAYANARHHLGYDVRHGQGGLHLTAADDAFVADRVAARRVLPYHVFEDQAVRRRPHAIFLVVEGREYSYADFLRRVVRVGNWLRAALGVRTRDVVAIFGPNSAEYMMLWMALDGLGACPAYINCNLTGAGLLHCVKVRACSAARLR